MVGYQTGKFVDATLVRKKISPAEIHDVHEDVWLRVEGSDWLRGHVVRDVGDTIWIKTSARSSVLLGGPADSASAVAMEAIAEAERPGRVFRHLGLVVGMLIDGVFVVPRVVGSGSGSSWGLR